MRQNKFYIGKHIEHKNEWVTGVGYVGEKVDMVWTTNVPPDQWPVLNGNLMPDGEKLPERLYLGATISKLL